MLFSSVNSEISLNGEFGISEPATADHTCLDLKLAALETSPLFDTENKHWLSAMTDFGGVLSRYESMFSNEFYLVIQSHIRTHDLSEDYSRYRQRNPWEEDIGLYRHCSATEHVGDRWSIRDQLSGIFLDSYFVPETARARYEQLLAGPAFCEDQGLWYSDVYGDWGRETAGPFITAGTFLQILIEERLFPERMMEDYGGFVQAHPAFDTDTSLWHPGIGVRDGVAESHYHAEDQLLGVIVMALFDCQQAAKQFEVLKATELYRGADIGWSESLENNLCLKHMDIRSSNQLLGLLAEIQLAEKSCGIPESEELVLPSVRQF